MRIGVRNVTTKVMTREEAAKNGYYIASNTSDDTGYILIEEGYVSIWVGKSVFDRKYFIID